MFSTFTIMPNSRELGLPRELLTAALKYLSQGELRNASEASWGFYCAAHDAGLALHRFVHSSRGHTISTFAEVVQHAAARTQLFRLDLTLIVFCRTGYAEPGLPPLHELWDAVRRAAPFLVRLDVKVDSELTAALYAALAVPAQQLRTLSIDIMSDDALHTPVPASLFAGDARRLSTVVLEVPALLPTWPQVSAWSAVRSVSVVLYSSEQRLALAHFFPGMRDVTIKVADCGGYEGQGPCVDLAGLALDSLTLNNDAGALLQLAFNSADPLPRISNVRHLCRAVHYDERLWPHTDCALNAHIKSFYTPGRKRGAPESGLSQVEVAFMLRDHPAPRVLTGAVVSVSSTNGARQWRNTQYTHPAVPGTCNTLPVLDALPLLRGRLVSLTIDDVLLAPLLQTACTLDALREIWLDCTPVHDARVQEAPPESTLRCPALEHVAVFSLDKGTPVAVPRERVMALASLRSGTHVSLVISRVTVFESGAQRLLSDIFSSVRTLSDADASYAPTYYHHREENPRLDTWCLGSENDDSDIDFSDTRCSSVFTG